jgi:histone arginine demethylase JMJD6
MKKVPCRSTLSLKEFRRQYLLQNQPVVIKKDGENKPTPTYDIIEHLKKKCGKKLIRAICSGNPQSSKRISLKQYFNYAHGADDDDPWYMTDWIYNEKLIGIPFINIRPSYFRKNLLDHIPKAHRPGWHWVYVGPRNSYSELHVDVMCTSAWTKILAGTKRWILFPPGQEKYLFTKKRRIRKSILKERSGFSPPSQCLAYQCITRAGDVIFIPSGWWHQALNTELTVAITENFVDEVNYPHFLASVNQQFGKAYAYKIKKWIRKGWPDAIICPTKASILQQDHQKLRSPS